MNVGWPVQSFTLEQGGAAGQWGGLEWPCLGLHGGEQTPGPQLSLNVKRR